MAEQEMMIENQTQGKDSPEVQSERELQLIQELVSIRKDSDRSLEYESLEGYRKPPGTHFAMLNKPTVTLKYGRMKFNMAAVRMFEGTINIVPMLHEGKNRLAIIPCKEEEAESVEWARYNKKGKWTNKEIRSEEFVKSIFELMGWDPTCRYKVQGKLANSERGLIFVFDLNVCICFEKGKETYTDPATGKSRQRQKMHYIDNFDGHIGMTYNEYEAARKMSQFEDIGEYIERGSAADSSEGIDLPDMNYPVAVGTPDAMVAASTAHQQMTLGSSIYNTAEDNGHTPHGEYYEAAGNE